MKLLVGLSLAVAVATKCARHADSTALRPGVLFIDGSATPTERTRISLEVTRLEGVSVLRPDVHVQSIADGEETECDILRFTLKNDGDKAVGFWSFYDRQECPCCTVEAWVDGTWSETIPYVTSDGRRGSMSPLACKYEVVKHELQPRSSWEFSIHVERWRFSVAEKLRASIKVVDHDPTAKLNEYVASNAFHVSH